MSTLDKAATSTAPPSIAEMPPLEVVTEGIPAAEHVREPAPTLPTRRPLAFQVLFWVVVAIVLGAFAVGVTAVLTPPPSSLHMGLSDQAWAEYRAGERVVLPDVNPVPFNPFLQVTPFTEAP